MKKLTSLVLALVASMCSMQSAWARTAPTFPKAQTMKSGKTYYLYNPGSDQFVFLNGSSVYADPSSCSALTVTNVEGNVYNLKFDGTSYYLYSSGSNVEVSSSTSSSCIKFRIDATDGGYTIQRDYNYNETYYVGNATGNKNLYSNVTEGNIVWQFYDTNGVAAILRYRAKKALYDALVSADDYSLSFAVEAYDALYANESATNEELIAAAETVNKALLWKDMLTSGESEYLIYTELTGKANWEYSSGKYSNTRIINGEGGLKAVVEVDQNATLVYNYHLNNQWYDYSLNVYLDGKLYQNINNYEGYNENRKDYYLSDYSQRFFVELTPGRHTIEWVAKSDNVSNSTTFYLNGIAAYKTPTITVDIKEAGSLGYEVLSYVDHIKEVRKLVVKGDLNNDDWERINMMTGLFELDLTETTAETLPRLLPGGFFHKLKLPKGLKLIEDEALSSNYIEEIVFPSTLTSIGSYAFRYTRIKEAVLPETVTNIGVGAFVYNQSLTKVVWPAACANVSSDCFNGDNMISSFELPEGVTTIGENAFRNNYSCNYQLPSSVTSIGRYAFEKANSLESLYIPANCTVRAFAFRYCSKLKSVNIGEGATFNDMYHSSSRYYYNETFYGCEMLEEVVFPTTFYRIPNIDDNWANPGMLSQCKSLKKVTFKSPTLIGGIDYNQFFAGLGTDIYVYVPSYLVNAYKLDPYWYNYNIMGFSTADVADWTIIDTLTFSSRDRFEGTPNVNLKPSGAWTINGDAAQNIGNLTTYYYTVSNGGGVGSSSGLISNGNNVKINGTYSHSYYAYNANNDYYSDYKGRWHFICLPFDIKVNEITTSNDARFAIRYYDGASRAQNGAGGNWKDYASDATITAGTGFIIQANKETEFYFRALNNASKQNVVSNKTFTTALKANSSTQTSDKGWNLVGNPWLCYYNIHKMNFTGPITVYDGYKRSYTAYSMIDDDYAILPNQAFFVQCPSEVNSISFPVSGRQITKEITSQNGVHPMNPTTKERRLVNVMLISDDEIYDQTRVVLNEKSSTSYEISCDASKFMSMDNSVPQLFTLDAEGIQYAINERPFADGIVKIGLYVAQSGTYTISIGRCDMEKIMLVDNLTGEAIDLSYGKYTFSTDAGLFKDRFELVFDAEDGPDVIVSPREKNEGTTTYNTAGQRVNSNYTHGIYIVNGKKVLK